MQEKSKFFSAKNVAILGVLLSLVIVLQAFGGSISIGAVTLNFTLIPIALGAIMLGPLAGGFLGLACGVVVLIQVIMGGSPFYTVIWTYTPVITALTCLVKTTVAGLVAGLLFKIIEKKNSLAAVFVASAIVPILNTLLFVIGCLFMNESILVFQESLGSYGGMNILIFILLVLVTFNFFIELIINLVLSPALHTVYRVIEKRIINK